MHMLDGWSNLQPRWSRRQGAAVAMLFWLVAGAGVSAAFAQASGDAKTGREIAERWCAACHMVAPDQPQASADVPTFMEIARGAGNDFSVLEGFMIDPHPPMPDMSLTRDEIRDVISYIATLR